MILYDAPCIVADHSCFRCFGLNMLATLPLEAFVCRSVMETFYFPDKPHSPTRHLILTSALVVSSVVLSLITSDLGAVFELIGSTSASMLAYILPPLCYIQLSQKSWKEKIPAISCIAFGAVVMITSIVLALSNIFRGKFLLNHILYRIWRFC